MGARGRWSLGMAVELVGGGGGRGRRRLSSAAALGCTNGVNTE